VVLLRNYFEYESHKVPLRFHYPSENKTRDAMSILAGPAVKR